MLKQLDQLIAQYRKLQPLSDDVTKKLDQKFRLEFNFNSNHLEGNTLTYGETKLLLLFDQIASNHEMRELEEMKAHDVALALIKQEARDKDMPLTEKFIKNLNEIILVKDFWKETITHDSGNTKRKIKVGQYKEYPNRVIQSNGEIFEYASPQETPRLMGELVDFYNTEEKKGDLSPIQLAALLHYRYIRIHPFDDGNGRVARLLVNYVLYRNDLPPVIIKSDKKNKDIYLRALQQADAGDLQAFVDYMINQSAWSLDLSIRAAKGENIEELDDWEKQLALLKKEIGDKGNPIVKKSEEAVKNILENVVIPFAELYESKMSQFDSLFMLHDYYLHYNGNAFADDSLLNGIRRIMDHNLNSIVISKRLFNFRQPASILSATIESLRVIFSFEKNAYLVQYDGKTISKLYSEYLTEEELEQIIPPIAKDLLQKIEALSQQ